MKEIKKQVLFWSITFVIVLVSGLYFFGAVKRSCDTDECFENRLTSCSPIIYKKPINNNIYVYTISRSLGDICKINVYLERSAEGTEFDARIRLEGKSMSCRLPKDNLLRVNLDQVENLLQYCSGPLKEGMYELIIKNMYSIIISNLGEVLGEVQTSLLKKI